MTRPSSSSKPRLREERPVALNVPVPYPLRDRLDEVLNALDAQGAPDATLKEVVAMLILSCPEGSDELFEMLIHYRTAAPQAALFGNLDDSAVVPFRTRSRGRPRKR